MLNFTNGTPPEFKPEPRHKGGRPSPYTEELAAEFCARIADGESMTSICADQRMPAKSTVFLWLRKNEDFAVAYTAARHARTEGLVEEALVEARNSGSDLTVDGNGVAKPDKESVARSKLIVDTIKWIVAHEMPHKYGELPAVELLVPAGTKDGDGAKDITPASRAIEGLPLSDTLAAWRRARSIGNAA